ncbi:MAG: nicotinamidase [Candidatus Daviesbacteria bacterium]
MSKEALIIVDVQNDFCPGGKLAVKEGAQVVEPINQLLSYGREKGWVRAATRDWHPAVTTHFDIWPVHCVQETEGAEFHQNLDLKDEVVFSKGMGPEENAYSGFDGKSEEGENLEEFLNRYFVKKVYVVGLATDYCVKATALDAANKGFETTVLLEACRAVNINPTDEQKAVEEMEGAGVIVTEGF